MTGLLNSVFKNITTIELHRLGQKTSLLKTVVTNADGRTDAPLLEASAMATGAYEIVFLVKAYFEARGTTCSFLDTVPIRFAISDATASYHVPLLVTPWAYNTYRGS